MNIDIDVLLNEIKAANQSLEKSHVTSSLFEKSNDRAVDFRSQGNDWYKVGQDNEALNYYTQSVASALSNSEELSLAYANRSAVLSRIGKYKLCLLDINRALKGNYPEHLIPKLHERKRRCLSEIKKECERETNITTSHENLNHLFFPTATTTREISGDETDLDDFIDVNLKSLSPCYPCKIKLRSDEKWGKYVIASCDIEPGEILSTEEFFSSISIVEQEQRNCSHCYVKCEALIPCHSCTRVLYCGERCRKLALDSYHRIECKIWPFCLNAKLNVHELLGLRTFLIGTDQRARLPGTSDQNITLDFLKKGNSFPIEAHTNNYLSVLQLCRNKTFLKPPKEIISKALTVVRLLRREAFFDNNTDQDEIILDETELCATVLLIHHFTTMELNNFTVSETICFDDTFCDENVLGFAICPFHNSVSHSCDSNVGDFVRRREHVLFALRPIKRGEKIYLSYGVSFSKNSIAERAKKLSAYGITCDCEACKHKWPLLKELQDRRPKFLTRNKNVIECIRSLNEIVLYKDGQTLETYKNAVKFCEMLHTNVKSPAFMIIMCESLIFGYMKSLGNFYSERSV